MPKVSIIIPTCNRAAYLKLAIESILEQGYQDFEIIVTDNASTDNTEVVVSDFKNEKIRYFKNEENIGVVKNHNLAPIVLSPKRPLLLAMLLWEMIAVFGITL